VVDAKYDALAWNTLAAHFIGDLSALPESDRNMIRWVFRLPATASPWTDAEAVRFTRSLIADLRAAYARFPADPGIQGLVTELLGTSPRFASMWQAHEVESRRPVVKRVEHPLTGPLEFECQVLHIPDTSQRLITYCAAPGSATQAAFRRLAKAGQAPEAPVPRRPETVRSRP
jgi:MmyB-like transcription regulator ligand binding domain